MNHLLIPCLLSLIKAHQFPPRIHGMWTNDGALHNVSQFTFPSLDFKQYFKESDVGVQSSCFAKLTSLISNLGSTDPVKATESLYFVDSAGKPGSGIMTGNMIMMGNYDQCQSLKNASANYYDYCTVKAQALLGRVYPTVVQWFGCLPAECRTGDASDVESEIYDVVNKYLAGALYLVPGGAVRSCAAPVIWDTGAYVAVAFMSLFAFLVLVGSLWYGIEPIIASFSQPLAEDTKVLVASEQTENIYEEIGSPSIQNGGSLPDTKPSEDILKDTSCLAHIGSFFKCFALQQTLEVLTRTDTKPGQILCINGIRVLSINWVVLGHTYIIYSYFAADPFVFGEFVKRRNFEVIINGLPSVDSFFTLSGFLVAYLLLKQLKNGMSWSKWMDYYVHRYVRLTIPYVMVILLEGFMYRIWVKGPMSSGAETVHSFCKDTWWTNILYVNNFVPKKADEGCIGQSWYLANDMQFFVIAPLFIVLLFKNNLAGLVANIGAIVGSVITTAAIVFYYKLGPSTMTDTNPNDFWLIYNKPYIRITPYIVGILGGWIYWKYGQRLSASVDRLLVWKRVLIATPIWLVSAATQYAVVFGLYGDIQLRFNENKTAGMADSIGYQTMARIAWALALIAQILACQCGLGGFIDSLLSWKGWLVLSRLTYSVYLLHLGLLSVIYYQSRHSFYFRPDYEMAILYLGGLLMSYLAATVLYVAVEQPLALLEALTYRKQIS